MVVTPPEKITPGILWWEIYDPEVKTNLSASAVLTDEGWIFIDPLPCDETLAPLLQNHPPVAIFLTNGNHQRASREFSRRWNVPIWAPAEAAQELVADFFFNSSDPLPGNARPIPLPGFGLGETAFAFPAHRLLVIGDAMINLASHPFQFLPEKYCTDHARALHSSQRLATENPEIILFAHGSPLREDAAKALHALCGHGGGT